MRVDDSNGQVEIIINEQGQTTQQWVTCLYCSRRNPAGEETCEGCGAALPAPEAVPVQPAQVTVQFVETPVVTTPNLAPVAAVTAATAGIPVVAAGFGCVIAIVAIVAALVFIPRVLSQVASIAPPVAPHPTTGFSSVTLDNSMPVESQTALAEAQTRLNSLPGVSYYYFDSTSHSVGFFSKAFKELGEVSSLGYPITEVFIEQSPDDGKYRMVQYFEKAVLEYHQELSPAHNMQLAALGSARLKSRYPGGTPQAAPLPGSPQGYTFKETGYTVRGAFLEFWRTGGGVKRFGYPISDSFLETSNVDGKARIAQYFERVVMEYHADLDAPYNVQLAPLGTLRLKLLYPSGAPQHASDPVQPKK
jgi:hypothetical protein